MLTNEAENAKAMKRGNNMEQTERMRIGKLNPS